jgi:hypothetical protein
MASIPVITQTQAAQIHAKAWAEDLDHKPTFKDTLDKHPAKAIDTTVRQPFHISADARLIDLNNIYSKLTFSLYDGNQLSEIYTHGTLNGQSVEMDQSEWVPPSTQNGQRITQTSPPEVSLKDWARIYAYIFFQAKFASTKDATIIDDFQKDPVKALVDHKITTALSISYNPGQAPLITHGGAPTDPGNNAQAFKDIMNASDAKGYRYIVRYCC